TQNCVNRIVHKSEIPCLQPIPINDERDLLPNRMEKFRHNPAVWVAWQLTGSIYIRQANCCKSKAHHLAKYVAIKLRAKLACRIRAGDLVCVLWRRKWLCIAIDRCGRGVYKAWTPAAAFQSLLH